MAKKQTHHQRAPSQPQRAHGICRIVSLISRTFPNRPTKNRSGPSTLGDRGRGQAKQLIAIRIDPTLLLKLRRMARKHGKPYQTFIPELLDAAAKKVAYGAGNFHSSMCTAFGAPRQRCPGASRGSVSRGRPSAAVSRRRDRDGEPRLPVRAPLCSGADQAEAGDAAAEATHVARSRRDATVMAPRSR